VHELGQILMQPLLRALQQIAPTRDDDLLKVALL
jgi:hypothetical protein